MFIDQVFQERDAKVTFQNEPPDHGMIGNGRLVTHFGIAHHAHHDDAERRLMEQLAQEKALLRDHPGVKLRWIDADDDWLFRSKMLSRIGFSSLATLPSSSVQQVRSCACRRACARW